MTPTRRGFIGGMAALFCAPAIVRASSLMAVRPVRSNTIRVMLPNVFEDTVNLLPDPDAIYSVGQSAEMYSAIWTSEEAMKILRQNLPLTHPQFQAHFLVK